MISAAFAATLATAVTAVKLEHFSAVVTDCNTGEEFYLTLSPSNAPVPCTVDPGLGGALGLDDEWFTTDSWNWRHYGEGTNPTATLNFLEDGTVEVSGSADPGSSWYVDDEGFMIHEWRANDIPHKMSVDVDAGTMTLVDPVRTPATFMDRV